MLNIPLNSELNEKEYITEQYRVYITIKIAEHGHSHTLLTGLVGKYKTIKMILESL